MGRRSWWLEEDGPKIYVYVNEGKKKDRLTDRKTGVPYPHVENVEVYPKKTDAVKFFFHSDSGSSITCPYVLERTYFEWNKSQYSKKFKETSNVREFVSLFSEMLSTNTERNTAPGNSSDSCSDVEDMSLSSDSASCSESSDKSFEKAVRKAKRRISDSTKDVSVVSLKRQKYNTDIEECKQDTQSTVQHAFCGHFLISVRALQGGQQIRVPDKVFLDKLVKSMEKYKDESYQPLCLLVKDVSSAEQFDGAKRNGYQYDVIGGQHTLLAIQELARKFPQDEKLKTVNCVVYAGLNNEERKWLGVRHNKTGEFRHALSLKEKVMICYGRRKEMPKDTKTTLWKESCKVILNEDKNSQTLDVACALASYDGLLYNKIMELFEKYEDGDLKEQRIKKKDQGHKPDIKPYKFKYLKSLDADTVLALVSDVVDKNLSLTAFEKESQILTKLSLIQRAFIQMMGVETWKEAMELFPKETQRENLSRFTKLPFRPNIPDTFVRYCQSIRKRNDKDSNTVQECLYGIDGSKGIVLHHDVLKLSPKTLKENGVKSNGFDCVIVDVPDEWLTEEIKELVITVKTINTSIDNYRLVLLCDTSLMTRIKGELIKTNTFTKVEEIFYYVENTRKEPTSILTESVHGVVIAYYAENGVITLDQVHVDEPQHNFWIVKAESVIKDGEGDVVSKKQKPQQLYEKVIKLCSSKSAWILDGTCGAGTGIMVGLLHSRNVVGVDINEKCVNYCKVRCDGVADFLEDDTEQDPHN